MNLPFHIAKRYLISKKSHNAVNIISLISVCGIIIATAALVCVMSVFNGFTKLAESAFNSFDPDLQISAKYGKVFHRDSIDIQALISNKDIEVVSETLEENALLKYSDRQKIILFKGVSAEFSKIANPKKILLDGQFEFGSEDIRYGILGGTVAYELGVRPGFLSPLEIYVPKRNEKVNMMNPSNSFNKDNIFLSGVFSLNQAKYDEQMFIIPIGLARQLLNYTDEVSAIDIKLKDPAKSASLQKEIQNLIGDNYIVKNRFQQQAEVYKMVSIEKWITFLILSIIVAIAIFNVVGSLSMLIIEKKDDIKILQSLGARNTLIQRIFFIEGSLIVFLGTIAGLTIGLVICLVQEHLGLLKLGASDNFLVADAYPVAVQWLDIFSIFIVVSFIGLLAILYPINNLKKNLASA